MPEDSALRRRLRLASVIAAALCTLVVIATFGMALPPSPWEPVAFREPTQADSNGTITAIADSASQRVLILDANDELTDIIDCTRLNSPLEKVTDVCVSGDTVYVAGVVYESDSDVIKRERIVAYDSQAVVALGIVCAVCAPLFYLTTRRSALRPPEQEQGTTPDQASEPTVEQPAPEHAQG